MTGLIVAAVILGLIVIVGAAALFMLLPILLAAAGFIVLLGILAIGTVLLLPNFVTLDQFKPQILAALHQSTGREITIGGPIGFTVWPVLGLKLNDISIGNPEGARDPIMLAAKELSVGVTLSSLVDRKLDVREVRVIGAQINLSVDRAGKGNWQFTPKAGAPSANDNKPAADSETADKKIAIQDINVQSVEIKDADISYEKAGLTVADLQNINLAFSMPSLDDAAKLTSDLELRGRKLQLAATIAQPRAIMSAKPSDIKVSFSIGGDKVALDGQLESMKFTGTLDAAVSDLGALAGWASDKPASLPVKALSLNAQVAADAAHADLKQLTLALDDVKAMGSVGANWSGARPRVTADLDVGKLNLDKLMGTGSSAASATSASAGAATEPDLSGLNAVNADVTLRLAGLIVKNLELGSTTAKVSLQGGRLQSSLTPASFYDGTVTAKADVNAGSKSFAGSATLSGVNVEPVLVALNGASRLTGKGDFTVNVSGPVATPDAIKRGLDGQGRFTFRDGAIKGVNIPALIRRAKSMLGATTTAESEGPQQTDFTELSGSFTINDGLVSNNDLKMLSPLVRVAGKGTFAIPAQEVKYRVDSSLVADLSGQGGSMERTGLVIPINITGTLPNLSYTPDVQGLVLGNVGNAQALGGALQNLNTKEGQRNTRSALQNMLGLSKPAPTAPAADPATAPTSPAPSPAPAPSEPNPANLLKNMLGGQ